MNPKIFSAYDARWSQSGGDGRRIPLTENFRSRELLLHFINPLFAMLMHEHIGGVAYEALEFWRGGGTRRLCPPPPASPLPRGRRGPGPVPP